MTSIASHRCTAAVTSLLLALWIPPALASSEGETAPPPAAAESAEPLRVWVEAGAAFDRAKLRAVLAQELKREVELTDDAASAVVRVRLPSDARAEVRYQTPGGEELSRYVDLPPDRERAAEVVSWLTVNLVRDEASELLSELRARRKREADAAAEQAAAAELAAAQAAADKAAAEQAAADAQRQKNEQAKLAANTAPAPQNQDANAALLRDPRRSFDLALATPLSLIRDSPQREMRLQLALWYGDSGGMRGIGVSTAALRIRRNLQGIAVAPVFTLVGGNGRGVVIGAGYAQVGGTLEGVLISAGAALGAKSLRGVALSAGLTLTRGASEGVLVAGGVNVSSDHRGLEVAGGVNVARDLQGVALAPVNVQRRVKGLQLGVVNVAEEVDGAALGLISYAKNGRLQPLLWTSIDGSAHVAVKSIAGYAFTQLGAGVDLGDDAFSYDAGVGVHLRLGPSWFFEPGLHYSGSRSTQDGSATPDEQRLHALAQLGYRVADKLDLLVAAGVRQTVAGGEGAKTAPDFRAGIAFF